MKIFLLFVCLLFGTQLSYAQLFINEVMSSNKTIVQDEAGQYDDWIELYNAGQNPIDLQSYFLSDNVSNPQKWEVTESVIIPAGGYVIFWADEDQSQGPTHTNFKLSAAGEPVILTSSSGTMIDQITIPTLGDDNSFGRITDGSNSLDILLPSSPGTTNNGSLTKTLKPVISLASGLYSGSQTVTITAEPSTTIYYTLDGSMPTTSSLVYSGPLTISSSGSIRAIAQKTGGDVSFVTTHSYIFGFTTSLPIFYITMDPDDLWSDQDGIYVTGTNGIIGYCDTNTPRNYNQPWEKEAHLKVFLNGTTITENNIGVEIGSNCKRRNPQKPLNLKFRDEYSDTGDNEFKYKIFPDNDLDEFKRLFLRDGNNDIPYMFRDASIARVVKPALNVDATSAQPTIVFLNGEYYGIQILREKWDKWHLAADHEKVQDRDSIDMVKNPGRIVSNWWGHEKTTIGDSMSWVAFIQDLRGRDTSIESDYQAVKAQVDYDALLNYLATEHFFGNRDWVPNNQRAWKEKGPDKKWRWVLNDLDNSLGRTGSFDDNNLASKIFRYQQGDDNDGSNLAFIKMFEHQEFRHEYIQRMNTYMELVFTNANYDPVVDALYNEVLPDLPMANQLYSHTLSQYTSDIANQKSFVSQRPAFVRDHMESQWNLVSSTFILDLNFNANSNGTVALHSNYFEVPANYQGTYHDNIMIDIHAVPDPGYRFSHWQETGSTDAHLYTSFTSNTTLTPIFVAALDLVINEIHYNPSGGSETAEFIEIYNPDTEPKALHSYEFAEGICFEFPAGSSIGPGEYIVIAHDASLYAGNGYQVFEWENSKLNNSGEDIHLVNRNGQVIDSLTYNDGGDWIGTADGGFYSLALVDPTLDNGIPSSWDVQSQYITPGAQNQFLPYDTYHFPSNLVINELHYFPFDSITPAGDTLGGKNYEFIEIKNKSNSTVNLSGVALSRGVTYEFPVGSTIPANGFVVIAEDSIQFIERYGFSPFGKYSGKLSNQGELVWLSNSIGNLMDAVRYDEAFPWDTNANGGIKDYSLALIDETKDNSNYLNWKRQCTELQTPNEENDFGCFPGLSYPGLMINELHYNSNQGNSYEYIEIVNHSAGILNLKDVSLSGGISYHIEGDFYLPGSAAAPFNYIVIADNAIVFQNQYGFAPHGEYFGTLSNAGERIILEDFFDNVIDEVTYDDVAPWDVLADQGQHSLALLSGNLDNSLAVSWCTQSAGSELTPKAVNVFTDSDSDGVFDCLDVCPAFDDALLGTVCDDGNSCTPLSVFSDCDCVPVENAALNGTATMSSQLSGFAATNLNDGVTNNNANSGLAHTAGQTQTDWVEIDLGSIISIATIAIHNRISCCSDRLSNAYVMISDTPFPTNTDVNQSISNADFIHQLGDELNNAVREIEINGSGRYVRIQKSGTNVGSGDAINLKEIEVFTPYTVEDSDNDGVCDIDDVCLGFDDSIDINNNGIPDGCEDCSDYINDLSGGIITQDTSAQIAIVSNGNVQSGNIIEYHAGSEVELTYGFEVKSGATFHAFIAPCN